ncbi:hypothetical protein [Kitasatospora sp. NPDC059327]|uniref:hypothetical protein n=1 Tax=Kitasatospora sp. NPDC059327 TaxID=3346803 RepID=UPI00368330B1
MTDRPRPGGILASRRIGALLASLAATAVLTTGASVLAVADTTAPPSPPGDNTIAPPSVEDFGYPGASGITNVKLLRGDGHLLLTDCAQSSHIQIWTRAPGNKDNKVCFTATTATGSLTLELADVFVVQTSGHSVRAGLTAGGTTQTLDIPKDGFKAVGEGLGQAPTSVVELHVTG